MRKIPTIFKRDPENMKYVLPEIVPGCEWVLAGEGTATRKYDGTCCKFDGERWWARREVRPGRQPPEGFQAVETDDITKKTVGWEPMEQSAFAKWHAEAVGNMSELLAPPTVFIAGTYELCGPKVNGNPESFDQHELIYHAAAQQLHITPPEPIDDVDMEFRTLRDWLLVMPYEGIVWHHPDGRMAKLKKRDFPKSRVVS